MLVEEPNIATLVQTLALSWTDAHPENNRRAKELLKRLPLLKSLDISTSFFSSVRKNYSTI